MGGKSGPAGEEAGPALPLPNYFPIFQGLVRPHICTGRSRRAWVGISVFSSKASQTWQSCFQPCVPWHSIWEGPNLSPRPEAKDSYLSPSPPPPTCQPAENVEARRGQVPSQGPLTHGRAWARLIERTLWQATLTPPPKDPHTAYLAGVCSRKFSHPFLPLWTGFSPAPSSPYSHL